MLIYGILIWNITEYVTFCNKEKDLAKRKKWRREQLDDFIMSLAVAPLVVVFDDELLTYYNKLFGSDYQNFDSKIYFISGFVIDRIVYGAVYLKTKLFSNGR